MKPSTRPGCRGLPLIGGKKNQFAWTYTFVNGTTRTFVYTNPFRGQFFDKHLAKVVLSNASVSFTTMNLDYLLNVSSRHLFFVTSTAQLSSIGCFSQGMTPNSIAWSIVRVPSCRSTMRSASQCRTVEPAEV